jgi:hypothetical protein
VKSRAILPICVLTLAGCTPYRSGIVDDLGTRVHVRIEGHGRCAHIEGDFDTSLHLFCPGDEIERIWVRRGTAPECEIDMAQARRLAAHTNAAHKQPSNRFDVFLSQVTCT